MPSYDYVCTVCGHEFELVQRMADPPRKLCPRCRKKVIRKVGKGAGIIFKGSGFYATDYRSAEYRSKEKAESGSDASKSGSDGSSGGKADAPAKPAGEGKGKSEGSGTKTA